MAVPALAVFAVGPLLPEPVFYQPVAELSLPQFLWRVMLEVPLATALCEELAFRGVLQAMFRRSLPVPLTIVATNVAFVLWHGVVNYCTIFETNVAPVTPLVPLAMAGQLHLNSEQASEVLVIQSSPEAFGSDAARPRPDGAG